jgi:putative transposase
LFRASAAALQQLAHDPRFLGGQIGMLGMLQTWTRDLRFHPHVHYLVPAIALASDGTLCRPRNPAFLVPSKALAILFRAKLRAALRQTDLYAQIPADTWHQAWVVDCRAVGSGAAALKYLAPYIFRVALSNNRIVRVQDDRVTFRYRDGKTKQVKLCTLPALTFTGRFLQHILPKGFVKVRY